MTWAVLLPLLVQYGLPVVEKLWQLAASNAPVAQSDWDALKALGTATRRQDMIASLLRNGVDPTSPQGQALLALIQ
jgi:hypothetical protein